MHQWFYAENGKQVGPVAEADFLTLVEKGTITPATLVWHAGMANWQTLKSLNLAPAAAPAPSSPTPKTGNCSQCGKSFFMDDLIRHETSLICAACKPSFFQKLQEGAELPGVMVYGGFWIRFVAKFLDGIIIGIVNTVISLAATALSIGAVKAGSEGGAIGVQLALWAIQMVVDMSYYVFFLGRYGATPGKMACKLKVVRSDGEAITYGRAAGRYFGDMLSGLLLGIGYLMAASDPEKRTLHDRICDTRVIIRQG